MSFLALSAVLLFARGATGPAHVVVHDVEGELLCDVRATATSTSELAREIAAAIGRPIAGLEAFEPPRAIDVDLKERPWSEALERVLGTVSLRPRIGTTITIERDTPEDRAERDSLAELRYRAALRAFPTHAESAPARLALGALLERRGEPHAARAVFEEIPLREPASPFVPDAWKAIAESALREGVLDEAARALSALGAILTPHPHHVYARRELARVLTRRGDARAALSILDALDVLHPTNERTEGAERLCIRAQALLIVERPLEALAALDRVALLDVERANAADARRLRGDALAGGGRGREGAIAWLAAAQVSVEAERAIAYRRACRMALDEGDAIGALAILRSASRYDADGTLSALEDEARAALGLDDDPERIAGFLVGRAEEEIAAGELESARARLDVIAATVIRPDLAARRDVALARCLDKKRGVEAAVEHLRSAVGITTDSNARRALYLGAASIFEGRSLFARAAGALEGEL